MALHQASKFLGRGLAVPLRDKGDVELLQIIKRENDLMVDVGGLSGVQQAVNAKQRRTNQEGTSGSEMSSSRLATSHNANS